MRNDERTRRFSYFLKTAEISKTVAMRFLIASEYRIYIRITFIFLIYIAIHDLKKGE